MRILLKCSEKILMTRLARLGSHERWSVSRRGLLLLGP
jgi:hypothetical protein